MSRSDPLGELARSEARAGMEQMAHERAIRRRVRGVGARRSTRPLAGLLAWAALGAALVTGIAAAAELI